MELSRDVNLLVDGLFGRWMRECTGPEFKVIMFICEMTVWADRADAQIPIKEITEATNLSRATTFRAIQGLEDRGFVVRSGGITNDGGTATNRYKLIEEMER